ncbi:hypothetical protein DFP73DRAFT_600237 [Morchella snyderi]|nr:hypothetical protein DFP73DRAFT_600237 [Morchella snyderi]
MPPLRRHLFKSKKLRPAGQPPHGSGVPKKPEPAADERPAAERPAEKLDHATAEKEEVNQLKYTFPSPSPSPSPSPWVRKRPRGEEQKAAAAAAAAVLHIPQAAEAPACTRCGGGGYNNMQYVIGLSALLDVGKMLLSMLCVVLGVVVMVLMSATWMLSRASAVLEGVHIGLEEGGKKRERERERKGEGEGGKVLIGIEEKEEEEEEEEEEGGSEVTLLRRDSRGELYELDNYGANQPEEGYEFVPVIRPVIVFREERLAFAAARSAWVGGRSRAASCGR